MANSAIQINQTVTALPGLTLNLSTSLTTSHCSPGALALGMTVIDSNEDAIQKLVYSYTSLLNIFAGRQPYLPSFYCKFFDFEYPAFSSSCLRSTESSSTTTVECQVREVQNYIPILIRDILSFTSEFDDYRKETSKNCSVCPNTANVAAIISMWNELSISLKGYVKIGKIVTLVSYVNVPLGSKVTNVVKETGNLIESFKNCSFCLVEGLAQDKIRHYKKCENTDTQSVSGGSGESVYKCGEKRKRSVQRGIRIIQRSIHFCRKRAEKLTTTIFDRLISVKDFSFELFDRALANFKSIALQITYVLNVAIKTSLLNFHNSMCKFNVTFSKILNNITMTTILTINSTKISLNATLQNATNFVTNQTNVFMQKIINDADLYPCCQDFANQILSVQNNFSQDITTCFAQTDSIINNISANITFQLSNFGTIFNVLSGQCDACVRHRCADKKCLNENILHTDITSVTKCIDVLSIQALNIRPTFFFQGNYTYYGVINNCTTAVQLAQQCSESKVQIFSNFLKRLEVYYAACKQNQTCDAMTTTPSKPRKNLYSYFTSAP